VTEQEFYKLNHAGFKYPQPVPVIKDSSGNVHSSPMEDFVFSYFRRDLVKKTPQFHRFIYHVCQHPEDYDHTLQVAPRGSAKSHIVSKYRALYQIYIANDKAVCEGLGYPEMYKPVNEMMIITAASDLAELWGERIKTEIVSNEKLINAFGYRSTEGEKNGAWRGDYFKVKTASGPIDIRCMGRGSKTKGYRPKIVVIDDLEDDESAFSDIQIKRITYWLRSTVEGFFDTVDSCSLLWIGTIISPQCVIDNAFNGVDGWSKEDWCRMVFPIVDSNGRTVWPDKFPDEFLERKRRLMGPIAFSCEYACKPEMALTPVWRIEDMQQRYTYSELPKRLTSVLSIDPAVSEKETADYTAMIVNSYCFDGKEALNVYNRDAEKGHWKAVDIASKAVDKYLKYHCEAMVLETVAAQEYLEPIILREAANRERYVNIVKVKPYKDKVTRARGVSFFFERGFMWFPENAPWLDEMLNEFMIFPTGRKDDYVDSEQMNLEYMKEQHNVMENEDIDGEVPKRVSLACPRLGW